MDDTKLISAVRQQRILYDVYATDYYNLAMREKIWEDIALFLGTTAKRCKTRWSYLRDLYTKAQKNRRIQRMKGQRAIKPWRYGIEMSFLDPFLLKQKKGPNAPNKNRKPNHSVEILFPEKNMLDVHPASVSPSLIPSEYGSVLSTENLTSAEKRIQTTASSMMVQNHPNIKVAPSCDALMKYFEAVAETVRGFSATLQVKVKSEISKIVHQAEMEDIQQSQFDPFMQSSQNYGADNQTNVQYPYDCAVPKEEQPGN